MQRITRRIKNSRDYEGYKRDARESADAVLSVAHHNMIVSVGKSQNQTSTMQEKYKILRQLGLEQATRFRSYNQYIQDAERRAIDDLMLLHGNSIQMSAEQAYKNLKKKHGGMVRRPRQKST